MQAEFALPSFDQYATSSTGSVRVAEAVSQDGGLAERPQWNEEAWRDAPQKSSMQRGSQNNLDGVLAHERVTQTSFQSAPVSQPPLPGFDVPPNDTSGMANQILAAHGAPYMGTSPGLLGSQSTQGSAAEVPAIAAPYVDALGNPLGPTKMSELPNIKDDPPALTDIQVHERQAVGSLGLSSLPGLTQQAPSVASTISAGHGFIQQTALSQVQLQQEVQGTPQRAYEGSSASDSQSDILARPLQPSIDDMFQAVAHERAPMSSRQPGTDSARHGTGVEREAPRQQMQQPQRTNDGTGDVAAGVAPPTPQPPLETSKRSPQNESSSNRSPQAAQRPPRRESGGTSASRGRRKQEDEAPQRPGKRDRSTSKPPIPPNRGGSGQRTSDASDPNDTSASQLKDLPPDTSEELQAELEECLDMIRWCGASVTRESLQDLKNATQPPDVVHDVLEAVALLLGQPETRWDKLKKMIASPTFLERIQRLNFQQNTTKEMFRQLRDYLTRPFFDEEQIKQVCVPVVPLAMWCRCIGIYLSKVKFHGGPEIRPVAAAGGALPQQQVDRRPAPQEAYNMIFDPDISSMSPDDLTRVKDLTISRPDVGTITFTGMTDCTGLDFSRIVRLEIGEVLVYPDSSLKPPVGVGLNKAAMVTMFQCWPPNGSRLLQDQKSQDRYKKKIKQMTEEKHATFLDYDCSTGVWKFCVEHF
jgi:hypothetical protein